MATAKKAALQSLTHEMRAQIKPTYLLSEVYEKIGAKNPNISGFIENLYNWKFISKIFPTKWDKFLNMPMSIDDKIRLSVKLGAINSIDYNKDGIQRLEIIRNYEHEYHFIYSEPDSWDGELFIEDYNIKNDLDVAVLWLLNSLGVQFYWEDGSWEMLEQEYNKSENPNEDFNFGIQLFNKYNNIAEEWKHKLRIYKKGVTPILKHLKKKSLPDVDRLWFSFLLYLGSMPKLYCFQTPEDGNLWVSQKYRVIPKNKHYQEQMKPLRDEWGYCAGITYYMTICDNQVYEDTLCYYEDAVHDLYDLVFNKNYWFHNYSPRPYYANKIKSFVSSEARYHRLLQFSGQSSLYGTIESVQRKILRFYNLIKSHNQKLAAKNRNQVY